MAQLFRVVLHRRMGRHPSHRHGQIQLDPVAGLPGTMDLSEALVEGQRHGPAVQRQLDLGLQAVVVAIQIARHRFVPGPAGDANVERERGLGLWRDGDRHLAVPRIARRLPHFDRRFGHDQPSRSGGKQVHVRLALARA